VILRPFGAQFRRQCPQSTGLVVVLGVIAHIVEGGEALTCLEIENADISVHISGAPGGWINPSVDKGA
jgi:hypothetical protein